MGSIMLPTPTSPPTRLPDGQKPKILVVEDESLVQRLYVAALSPEAEVVIANNGREGFDHLFQSIVDGTPGYKVILTDNSMPIKDGLIFLEEILQYEPLPPRLMVASVTDPKHMHEEVRKKGGLGLMEKPFDLGTLRTVVRELLQNDGKSPKLEAYFAQQKW